MRLATFGWGFGGGAKAHGRTAGRGSKPRAKEGKLWTATPSAAAHAALRSDRARCPILSDTSWGTQGNTTQDFGPVLRKAAPSARRTPSDTNSLRPCGSRHVAGAAAFARRRWRGRRVRHGAAEEPGARAPGGPAGPRPRRGWHNDLPQELRAECCLLLRTWLRRAEAAPTNTPSYRKRQQTLGGSRWGGLCQGRLCLTLHDEFRGSTQDTRTPGAGGGAIGDETL